MARHQTLLGMLTILTLSLPTVYAWAAPCPPGDLTGDCQVNIDDLVFLAQHWLDAPGSPADIDGGGVGLSDLGILSDNWQKNFIILKVTVRNSYLPGIPFLVRAELLDENGKIRRDIWDATATLSVVDNPSISLSATQIHLINGLGSVLVTPTGNGVFKLKIEVSNRSITKTLTQLDPSAITSVSGSLSSSQTWNGAYHITGDLAILSGNTLTLSPETMILIDGATTGTGGADIDVFGSLQSLGTEESPVTITAYAAGKNFGELHFTSAQPSFLQYTDINRGGRSPGVGHTGTGPVVRVNNSTVVFDHANLTDNPGKIMHSEATSSLTFRKCLLSRSMMGPEIAGTALLFEDSWLTDMRGPNDADGIYVNAQQSGQTCVIRGGVSAFIDDDGIDLLSPTITIEDYLIHDTKDKGLSIFNGTTTVRNCMIVETNISPEDPTVAAVAAKADNGGKATVFVDRTTIVASRMAGRIDYGIQSNNKSGYTSGRIYWTITNSIVDATDPIKVDSPYLASDIAINYSDLYDEIWPGTGNLHVNPQFVNRAAHDYRLATGSPCIDAGDPTQTDPDGSRTDQGYSPFGSIGVIAGDMTTWKAALGPYRVRANLIIPVGATLAIEPGTSVYVDPGLTIRVEGTLVAEGEPLKRIRICRTPGTTGAWGGILFSNSTTDNRIRYAIIEQARSTAGMVGITNSRLLLEQDEFGYTGTETLPPLRRVHINNSSVIVRNCVFTDVCKAGQAPTDNNSEHIWGAGILAGGEVLLEGNTFGRTPGHNDAFDFDSLPGQVEIPCIRNNHFLGGGDDALDLETNAYIEGNVFENYVKDTYNLDPGESNVVSAGAGKQFVMVRNVIRNSDHAAQVKDNAYLTFLQNTVDSSKLSAIFFGVPPSAKGKGVLIDGCIFRNSPTVLPLVDVGTVEIAIHHSIVPAVYLGLGVGNIDAAPLFVNTASGDYHLRPGSPAIGTGPSGIDMGAMIPGGVVILSGPNTPTPSNTAAFTFFGAGMVSYRYRLDGGAFSAEQPITQALTLSDLSEGPHKLEVIGCDFSSHWQEIANGAVWEWTVDPE